MSGAPKAASTRAAFPVSAPSSARSLAAAAPTASTYSGSVPGGAFGQCTVSRDSGGQAQIINASDPYGRTGMAVRRGDIW